MNLSEIRTKLKTRIKTEIKYAKHYETTSKYVGYVEDIQQEMKITERKRVSKVDVKQTRLRQVRIWNLM